jgi:hypothetical protein
LSTANLSAERKKMPLAGLNIPEHLFEDGRSIRYAAIRAPLTTDLTDHRAVRRFQETGQFTADLDLVEKEQPHTATIDF